MTTQITLPAPTLTADFVQRHEGDGTVAAALRTLGEAIARQSVLESLSAIRSTHQGVKLVTEAAAATDSRSEADAALDEHIADWDEVAQLAQEVNAREAAIEILAGMVARLIAEK